MVLDGTCVFQHRYACLSTPWPKNLAWSAAQDFTRQLLWVSDAVSNGNNIFALNSSGSVVEPISIVSGSNYGMALDKGSSPMTPGHKDIDLRDDLKRIGRDLREAREALECRDLSEAADDLERIGRKLREAVKRPNLTERAYLSQLNRELREAKEAQRLKAIKAQRLKAVEAKEAQHLKAVEAREAERLKAAEAREAERLKTVEAKEAERLKAVEARKAQRLKAVEAREAERLKAVEAREAQPFKFSAVQAKRLRTRLKAIARQQERVRKKLEEEQKEIEERERIRTEAEILFRTVPELRQLATDHNSSGVGRPSTTSESSS